jgi:TolB-like protein/class 3 adenylate cyclase
MATTRRLAAIVAADVSGYSRLMGMDEEGTHDRLSVHHRQLVDPKINEHHGRIVKTTGDGMLVEFASVVDAVRCAAEIQRAMIDREAEVAEDRRIRFRVGINLGDIIVDGDDIFGDGVNVAARLEALALPGGICISRVVRDQIRDKLPYAFENMGEQSVKNIARPVRAYALRAEAIAALPVVEAPAAVVGSTSGILPVPAASSDPAAAPRLSIVVLPFTNLSNDPEQDYFADGITEDLTTDLSRIGGSFVIARNTAFTYKGKPVDAKQIGRELGVRYLLEGSMRRSGQQVRVNAQLVDAETGAHLWAERLDRDMGDLFRLQNEITGQIARALQFELAVADAGRFTEDPDALDYILRGRAAWWKLSISRENIAESLSMFEHALALDPRAVEAQIGLAHALVNRVLDFPSDEYEVDVQRADELIAQALAVSPNSAWAHYVKGQVLRAQSQFDDAVIEYETAIAFDRNLANAYAWLGRCMLWLGSVDEVIPLTDYAIRLSPRDRNLASWYWQIGVVYLLKARTDEAVPWFEKARSAYAGHHFIHASLAAAYALKGETKRASVALGEARRLSNRYSSITHLKAVGGIVTLIPPGRRWFEAPKLSDLAEATYFAGLRRAGMPDE